MRLSHFQRLVLKNLLELQRREPSYRKALRSLVPAWIVFLAVGFAAWYAIRTWLKGDGLEYIALGLVLGAIAAQFGGLRNFIQSWAVQKQVLDYEAVNRLLAEDDAGKAAGEPLPRPKPLSFGWRTAVAIGLVIVAVPLALDWGMTVYHDPTARHGGATGEGLHDQVVRPVPRGAGPFQEPRNRVRGVRRREVDRGVLRLVGDEVARGAGDGHRWQGRARRQPGDAGRNPARGGICRSRTAAARLR
jgi:hypothetical protein